MKYLELYTGQKTYMFPNGAVATPETVLDKFSAILTFPHLIETDESGQVMFAVQNLSAMRSMYNIDKTLSDVDAIEAIEAIINAPPPEPEPSPEERTAAAMEFLAINSLPTV